MSYSRKRGDIAKHRYAPGMPKSKDARQSSKRERQKLSKALRQKDKNDVQREIDNEA